MKQIEQITHFPYLFINLIPCHLEFKVVRELRLAGVRRISKNLIKLSWT